MKAPPHCFGVHPLIRPWFVIVLLSTLLLAACGGGGGDAGGNNVPAPAPAPAPTLTLAASPTSLATGGNITLNWSSTGANSCAASSAWTGSKATTGTEVIAAPSAGSLTFTLGCTGAGGSISRSATVTVNTPPPSGPTLLVSHAALNVAGLTYAPAPTGSITITLLNFTGPDPLYVGGSYSTNGIASLTASEGNSGPLVLSITFRNPTTLGPGTYTDQVTVRACREAACINHINGSPQAVTVTYVVTANPNPPSVSFNANTVSATHDNVGSFGTRTDESIRFSIANRGNEPLFTRATVEGAAVVAGQAIWNGDAQGTLRITLREPGALAAGDYTGKVRLDVCHDAACTAPLPGSPGLINVAYRVTGNAFPNTQVLWNASGIQGATLVTSETRTPIIRLSLRVTNLPAGGLYVRHTPSATGLIIGGVNAPPSYTSLVTVADKQFDVALKSPASLGSGIFTDTMTFDTCFDAACTQLVPGGRYVLSPSMLVMATEGVEYTRRLVLPGGTADAVVWSPVDRFLYVAAGATNGGTSRIVQVDPVTGAAGLSTPLNNQVHRMAVTPDGSYLYAGSGTTQSLHRLLLPSLTPDLAIQLGERDSFTPFATTDIDTLPGLPRSVVVAVKVARTGEHVGVRVYDDATPRPDELGPVSPPIAGRWLVPAADPGQFISWRAGTTISSNALERLSVDASGIRVDSSLTLPLDRHVGGQPLRVGNKLYSTFADILDATTGEVVGAIPVASSGSNIAVVPDERNRRLFVWTQVQGAPAIVSYDLDTMQLLAYAPMQFGSGSMVLWGDEGVALTNGSSVTVLSGPFFSTYRGEPRP